MTKENFKGWLINNGYTENTSVSYSNSIGRISENEEFDIYGLNDLKMIKELVEAYSTTGKFSEIGYEGRGTVRNAIKALYKYKKELFKNDGESFFEYTDIEIADQIIHGFSYRGNLRKSIIEQIPQLFPDYKLLNRDSDSIDYTCDDSFVDLLLENNNGDLMAVKLEPGAACVDVLGELAIYFGFLMEKFPEKSIKGCIIAGEIMESLKHASKISDLISLKTYKMRLELEDF